MLGNRWGYTTSKTGQTRPADDSASDIFDSILVMVVGALLMWRLLVPTEGSVEGRTLWIALLWPLALVVWGIAQFRSGTWRIRCGWLDAAVWLLVGGHVVSALRVLATTGDKRASLNMLWEWLSLGIAFFLVRQTLVDRSDRRNLALMLTAAAMTLAGLGVHQHFFGYRELQTQLQEVERQWKELDRLDQQPPPENPRARADWEAARNKVFFELEQQDIPTNPEGARMLFRQRIESSSEPFGLFGLANSFAGLLVCWLVFSLGVIVAAWQQKLVPRTWVGPTLLTVVLAFCLVLTKSRTAYVGLLVGLAAWGFGLARALSAHPQRIARWGLGAIAAVALLGTLGWATGGVDRLVFSESGKSLRYRLEYWRGTWSVLRESPANLILGVGPGNFRQHYLAHKLPESSEEIVDPHNMVLDAWANGGLLALIGLGGLCLTAGLLVFYRSPNSLESATSLQQTDEALRIEGASGSTSAKNWAGEPESGIVINGFLLGGGLGFLAAYLAGATLDNRLPILAFGWAVAAALCHKLFRQIEVSPSLLGAAAVALLVHLLGAGGIGMPAITQTLFVLLALGAAEIDSVVPQTAGLWSGTTRPVPVAAIAGGLGLTAACFALAVWPVTSSKSALAEAMTGQSTRGNADKTSAALARAAAADPLAAEPRQRQALLGLQFALGATKNSDAEAWMEKAVAWQQEAIERDPLNANQYRTLADYELEFGKRNQSPAWFERAAADYIRALARYPNNPTMQSDLARAWSLAKRPDLARPVAQRALELHEINVQAGHPDKQLPAPRLQLLKEILTP